MDYICQDTYKQTILNVNSRKENRFIIAKILLDDILIGFVDYVCYRDEAGKCLIGNFYINSQFRNKGDGTEVYHIVECELKS